MPKKQKLVEKANWLQTLLLRALFARFVAKRGCAPPSDQSSNLINLRNMATRRTLIASKMPELQQRNNDCSEVRALENKVIIFFFEKLQF